VDLVDQRHQFNVPARTGRLGTAAGRARRKVIAGFLAAHCDPDPQRPPEWVPGEYPNR
jgi:hypothetical protein